MFIVADACVEHGAESARRRSRRRRYGTAASPRLASDLGKARCVQRARHAPAVDQQFVVCESDWVSDSSRRGADVRKLFGCVCINLPSAVSEGVADYSDLNGTSFPVTDVGPG